MREAAMIGLIELVLLCGEVSAGSHSLRYFLSGMTPVPGFPEFVAVGYVDDVQFVVYDSDRRELIPREQWMVESEGLESWERKKMLVQEQERYSKADIPLFMSRANQSGGIHVYQTMTGCDLRDGGTTSGFNQFGWDGKDFISFDKDHMVWVTPITWGEIIKNNLDRDIANSKGWKSYLEGECIEWLKKYLEYGQRELRVVAPVVSFTRLGDSNQLSCAVTGFYPQAIEVNLWRDGVVIDETLSTGILPNHDSTYQIRKWVEFDPEDQAGYSCRVEHSGMKETLVVIYEPKSRSQVAVTVGIVVGVLVLIALIIVAVIIYNKKGRGKSDYNPTKTSDGGDSSSSSSTRS
ncbi:class I histocompatibility antigen, F10 alpha chain-like [Mustelus asterias]